MSDLQPSSTQQSTRGAGAAEAGCATSNGTNSEPKGNTAPSSTGANGPQGPPVLFPDRNKKVYRIRGTSFEVDTHYDVIKAIGVGAYGLVCSARDVRGQGRYCAIKKIPKLFDDLVDGKRVLRELKVMRQLKKHPNIIQLYAIMPPSTKTAEEKASFRDVYIATELMDTDLHLILKSKQKLSFEHHAYFMFQLLKGMAYVHSAGVIHRDLKPGNLLLNANCDLKICDFGLSRAGVPLRRSNTNPEANSSPPAGAAAAAQLKDLDSSESSAAFNKLSLAQSLGASHTGPSAKDPRLTDYVITRWYRPPELLLMCPYDHAADVWSIGCIMAEALNKRALFQGRDYMDQLRLIAEFVDCPTSPNVVSSIMNGASTEAAKFIAQLAQQVSSTEALSTGKSTPEQRLLRRFGIQPNQKCPSALTRAVDLTCKLLAFDPSRRPTAAEALQHPYFAHVFTPKDIVDFEVAHGAIPAATWEFETRDLDEIALRELFWNEMLQGDIAPPPI